MLRSWGADDARRVLGRPTAGDDKYSRGVVGLRTGSQQFPGAAVLGVEGAWRTGIGMVRYLGPSRATRLVLARRPETVTAEGRVQAWVIGSGTSVEARTDAETRAVRNILDGSDPVVVDAGALDLAASATAPAVITPERCTMTATGICWDIMQKSISIIIPARSLGIPLTSALPPAHTGWMCMIHR